MTRQKKVNEEGIQHCEEGLKKKCLRVMSSKK